MARNNEVLAVRQTDRNGFIHFEAGLARGEGGSRPRRSSRAEKADYAFLSLKSPAFDLSDRGVAGRRDPGRARCLRLYGARGLSQRRKSRHNRSAARCARRGGAECAVDRGGRAPRWRRIPTRCCGRQGLGGRALTVPIVASASTGTWRVAAYTDPKRPPVGETTFMVEDYVPDRIEF